MWFAPSSNAEGVRIYVAMRERQFSDQDTQLIRAYHLGHYLKIQRSGQPSDACQMAARSFMAISGATGTGQAVTVKSTC